MNHHCHHRRGILILSPEYRQYRYRTHFRFTVQYKLGFARDNILSVVVRKLPEQRGFVALVLSVIQNGEAFF